MTWPSDRTTLRNSGQKSRMTARLTIHSTRRYDDDNLQGCQKPVLDALKNLGYIRDDSPQWLELRDPIYSPSTRKAKRTEIQIFPDRETIAVTAVPFNL
jgi:Holliday junction resolvase RusA-like endonuclease